jgi:hypothetical protein
MMNKISSTNFNIYKIHVVDQGKNHLESLYYNFENKADMDIKWQELLREDHYSIEMIYQEVTTIKVFHS